MVVDVHVVGLVQERRLGAVEQQLERAAERRVRRRRRTRSRHSPPPSRPSGPVGDVGALAALGGHEVEVVRVARIPCAVLDPVQGQPVEPSPRRSGGAPGLVPVDLGRRSNRMRGAPLPYFARNCASVGHGLVERGRARSRRRWSEPGALERSCRCVCLLTHVDRRAGRAPASSSARSRRVASAPGRSLRRACSPRRSSPRRWSCCAWPSVGDAERRGPRCRSPRCRSRSGPCSRASCRLLYSCPSSVRLLEHQRPNAASCAGNVSAGVPRVRRRRPTESGRSVWRDVVPVRRARLRRSRSPSRPRTTACRSRASRRTRRVWPWARTAPHGSDVSSWFM